MPHRGGWATYLLQACLWRLRSILAIKAASFAWPKYREICGAHRACRC